MADSNLIKTVLSFTVQMAAELGTSQAIFTLDCVDQMRSKVRKDHWELLTELERSDESGRDIANSILLSLLRLAFSNIRSARIVDKTTLEVVLINRISIHITDPAQREQE